MIAIELRVQPGERLAHVRGGAHRPQRVVLADVRHPEDRHHRVADELLDRAAVPLDRRTHRVEVARVTIRSRSGSRRSPIAVEPTMSLNTIVTVLRVSAAGAGPVRGAPHSSTEPVRLGVVVSARLTPRHTPEP